MIGSKEQAWAASAASLKKIPIASSLMSQLFFDTIIQMFHKCLEEKARLIIEDHSSEHNIALEITAYKEQDPYSNQLYTILYSS